MISDKRPSIAIPVLSLRHHGGIKILIELANRLSAWADIDFIVPKGCVDTTYEIQPSVNIIQIPSGKFPRFLTCAVFLLRCIPLLIRYDLVIANFFVTWFSSVIATNISRKKMVYIVQDIESKYHVFAIGKILNWLCDFSYRSNSIITANKFLEAEITSRGSRPLHTFTVGISEPFFTTDQPGSAKKYDVVYFARSESWKNLALFIDFLSHHPTGLTVALITQEPELIARFPRAVKERHTIDLFKPATSQELIGVLDLSRIMVSTSILEGFSLPPLEAMARGLAVLLYPSGGPSLYVENERNAVYFTTRQELSASIHDLLQHDEKRAHLGREAVATAQRYRFSLELDTLSSFLSGYLDNPAVSLVYNVSMLGAIPTGMGVYSQECARVVESYFDCTLVSPYNFTNSRNYISSPKDIAIGAKHGASLKRILYLWRAFPQVQGLIYTPTHHGVIRKGRQIITIHDLIPIHYPLQNIPQFFYFKLIMPKIIKAAIAVFTVSETSKLDIARYYAIPKSKIHVIPNGVNSIRFCPLPAARNREDDYLLVVGANYPHKNIHELLLNHESWAATYRLKIVGAQGAYSEKLRAMVITQKLAAVVDFIGYVTDEELVALYQGCSALVYPSLCEGFGIPPLEAMACGRPVIASDIPSLREIGLDVPIYIQPGVTTSWQSAFSQLNDSKAISAKITAGLELVKQYTWQRSGEILIESLLRLEPHLQKKSGTQ